MEVSRLFTKKAISFSQMKEIAQLNSHLTPLSVGGCYSIGPLVFVRVTKVKFEVYTTSTNNQRFFLEEIFISD